MLPPEFRRSLKETAKPQADILSLADAKAHLKVDTADDDAYISGLIAAVEGFLDGPLGYLSRALITQSWEMRLDSFGMPWYRPGDVVARLYGQIVLPLSPLQSLDSVKYVDVNGVTQTADPSLYQLVEGGQGRALIVPAFGKSWPPSRAQMDAVTIAFTAGYGAGAADIPAPIVQAAKLLIGNWYENREASEPERGAFAEVPFTVTSLLTPFRVSWF